MISHLIISIYRYINDELDIDTITDISSEQLLEFFESLEMEDVQSSQKKRKYNAAKELMNYIRKGKKIALKEDLDDLFNEYTFNIKKMFTDMGVPHNVYDFTIERLTCMLNYFKERDYRAYVMFLTLGCTGMRIGALCNLKRESINWEARRIKVLDKKTKNNTSGINKYVIPIPLVPVLKVFIDHIPTNQQSIFDLTDKTMRVIFNKWADNNKDNDNESKATPHALRHAISYEWADKGLVEAFSAGLLNQTPKGGVNSRIYTGFKNFTKKREKFDEYFPYWSLF